MKFSKTGLQRTESEQTMLDLRKTTVRVMDELSQNTKDLEMTLWISVQ
jgi:hypothetical protein